MRLDKLLANSGCGTRSSVRSLISSGLVAVDGRVIKDCAYKVTGDEAITFRGTEIETSERLYYLLDKPDNVLTAMEDPRLECVGDFIPPELSGKKLAPVGRLDYHTTGLLIITNDGELSHRLQSPKYHIAKRYLAGYKGSSWSDAQTAEVSKGVTLTDMDKPVKTAPAEVKDIADAGSTTDDSGLAEITLYEGKTHEVRRIFAHFGKEVVTLRRFSLAGLEIDRSADNTGTLIKLGADEIALLKSAVGL